jgi:hypothetical protein
MSTVKTTQRMKAIKEPAPFLHMRLRADKRARYDQAVKAEDCANLTDWVTKALDARCDLLGIPKPDKR